MAYNEKLNDRIREAMYVFHDVEEKHMFGGTCYMLNGKMCVGVVGDEMMCRIDPDVYASALERKGCREMVFTGKPMKGYVYNDLLARPELDRFRTGGILVQYQYRDQLQLAVNCTMWTGQMGNNRILVSNGFFPYGYMDTTGGHYTQYSHGLLSTQAKANLGHGQIAQANLGVDAEQVRNFVQNRLIHDLAFLPKKWHNPRNCHLPMVDTAGNPYLHLPGQKIK
eukprot:gene9988-9793_t